jgi:dihydrofolate reductase
MRKLIYGINLTLDGCCDHTKGVADGETHEYWTDFLRTGDLLVYGRKTYELMVPFWPEVARTQSMNQASNDFARVFDSIDRVVFSRTLDQVEDRKTRLVRTDLRDEILRLKQEEGTNILTGGVDLPSQLMALGLIDEYRMVVGPVIAGAGRRLFDDVDLEESARLKLVGTKTFKSGCVALHYLRS